MGGCISTSESGGRQFLASSVGLWAQGLALQIGAGGVMFFTGYKWGGLEELQDLPSDLKLSNAWKMMEVMGMIHVCLAIIFSVLVILNIFLSDCFKWLMRMGNLVNCAYCVATTAACGYYLNTGFKLYYDFNYNVWMPSSFNAIDKEDPSFLLYLNARGRLLVSAVMAMACLAPFSRASSVKASDPAAESILYVTCLILYVMGGITLVLPTNIINLMIMGGIWIALAVLVALLLNLAGCCPKDISMKLLGIVVLAVSSYGLVVAIIIGAWYEKGRDLRESCATFDKPFLVVGSKVEAFSEEERKYFDMYFFMYDGSYLLAVIIMGFAVFVAGVFCSIFSLFYRYSSEANRDLSKQH